MAQSLSLRSLSLIIIFVGLLAYANSFSGGFVWDDYPLIINNPLIQDWHNLPKLFYSDLYKATWGNTNFYRPLVSLSFMWDYALWKEHTFGYHLTNVILHLINAVLFFLILNKLTHKKLISFWSSILFLTHPFNPAVVTYISGRADSLALGFILWAFFFFIKWDDESKRPYYLFSIVLFIFALLSKEIAAIFPFLLLLYLWYFKNKNKLAYFLPFLIIAIVYLILRCTILDFSYHPIFFSKYTLFERMISIPKIILSYLQILIFPFNLHMERIVAIPKSLAEAGVLWPFFILVLIFLAVVILNRRDKLISFGMFWFIIALFPFLGVISLNAVMAEHWLYLPSLGAFLTLSVAGSITFKKRQSLIFLMVCLVFSVITINRNTDWNDEFTFFKRTLAKAPHSARMHEALGTYYAQSGFYGLAIKEYQEAISLKPEIFQAHFNLGAMYQKFSMFSQAEEEYKKVLALYSDFPEAHNNLGVIYFYQKNYPLALSSYTKAIELRGDYAQAYNNRGAVYISLGEAEKAKQDWQKALSLKPDYQSPKLNLEALNK